MTMTLSAEERELIFELAEKLIGSFQKGSSRRGILVSNVARRMDKLGHANLFEYLTHAYQNEQEFKYLLSALTIHTTAWFRELPHFQKLKDYVEKNLGTFKRSKLKLLSVGCSSGEETYSFGLVLESLKQRHPGFDFEICGIDIDPISIDSAREAIYLDKELAHIPREYHKCLWVGNGRFAGKFTVHSSITERTRFKVGHIADLPLPDQEHFDVIVCRNLLIYFSREVVDDYARLLTRRLSQRGILMLGHSEAIDATKYGLENLGNCTYIQHSLGTTGGPSPQSLTRSGTHRRSPYELIVVGASTGGIQALSTLLARMPPQCPPVLVVQHIAAPYAETCARRLADESGLKLGDSRTGEPLRRMHLYMALSDQHVGASRSSKDGLILRLSDAGPLNDHRPSVDHLFLSCAKLGKISMAAVLLTGMGKDGAKGLLALKEAGADTMVQDEASSVVFGMPKEAIALGAAGFVGSPSKIRERLLTRFEVNDLRGGMKERK